MAAHFESALWTGVSRDMIARWPLSVEAWLVLKTETQAASGVGQGQRGKSYMKCVGNVQQEGAEQNCPECPAGMTLTHS